MIDKVNNQSSNQIFNGLSQAENAGKKLAISDNGEVKIANFANKIATAFHGIDKNSDSKAKNAAELNQRVLVSLSNALEREGVTNARSAPDASVFQKTQSFFKGETSIRQVFTDGELPSVASLREALAFQTESAE